MAELDDQLNQPSESEKRIKQLSDKVKLTSEERDEQARLLKEQGDKNTELTRERDFYQGFSDVVATNPAAKDHRDDILAKVKSGYTVEDATYAVLGKAGKLSSPKEDSPQIAGGSAATATTQETKTPDKMTQAERLEALKKLEIEGVLTRA